MNKHTSRYLCCCHEELMAVRLSRGEFSLNMERGVLQALPDMPRAQTMLRDVEISGSYNLEFKKFLLNRIDEGAARLSSSVVDLAFQSDNAGPNLTINVFPNANWTELHSSLALYRNLKLPEDMGVIVSEFELYYSSLPSTWSDDEVNMIVNRDERFRGTSIEAVSMAEASHSDIISSEKPATALYASGGYTTHVAVQRHQIRHPWADYPPLVSLLHPSQGEDYGLKSNRTRKRISWSRSSGRVVLTLSQGTRLCRTFTTNEPMATVLMLFNKCTEINQVLTTSALSKGTGLSYNALSVVLNDLCTCKPPILEATADGFRVSSASLDTSGDRSVESWHSSPSYTSYSRLCEARAASIERGWISSLVDAALVRVAKKRAGWIPFFELCDQTKMELSINNHEDTLDTAKLIERCDSLSCSGVLLTRYAVGGGAEVCEYCYYLYVDHGDNITGANTGIEDNLKCTVNTTTSANVVGLDQLYNQLVQTLKIPSHSGFRRGIYAGFLHLANQITAARYEV